MRRIRTLIVDDSALVRRVVTEALGRFPEIEVIGSAPNPYVARDKILELNPDVITLDIEMPRMDGITFLKLLMKHRPMPVVVMSSLTQAGSAKAMEALEAGAVEVIGKPRGSYSADEDGTALAAKIRAAAASRFRPSAPLRPTVAPPTTSVPPPAGPKDFHTRDIILIGASTGGTTAIRSVFEALPADVPPICVVQHIGAPFSATFAQRLNECSPFKVTEARGGELLEPRMAIIAPGDHHVVLQWTPAGYRVHLNNGPRIHHQRPAVDVLFDSLTKAGGARHCVAALLTGMGKDGAAGLKALRNAGAHTIAESEETCVVFGMPREAIALDAAIDVLPLPQVAPRIVQWLSRHAQPRSESVPAL
jgi:two-component system, chemotaxis family, protein-glutamate methylesterase/glutaminase